MGSSEDSQRSAAIIPARMNKLNSKEFTIVDQVKKLMVACTGPEDTEWLFVCQSQNLELCEAAGSKLGALFLDEVQLVSIFSGFICNPNINGSSKTPRGSKRKLSTEDLGETPIRKSKNSQAKTESPDVTTRVCLEIIPAQGNKSKPLVKNSCGQHIEENQNTDKKIGQRTKVKKSEPDISSENCIQDSLVKNETNTKECIKENFEKNTDFDDQMFDGFKPDQMIDSENPKKFVYSTTDKVNIEPDFEPDNAPHFDNSEDSGVCKNFDNFETEQCIESKNSKETISNNSQNGSSRFNILRLKSNNVVTDERKKEINQWPSNQLQHFDAKEIEFNNNDNTCRCSVCFKTFKSQAALRGHQNAHRKKQAEDTCVEMENIVDEIFKYECTNCGEKFVLESQLQNHMTRKISCRGKEIILREKLAVEIVRYTDKTSGEERETTITDLLNSLQGSLTCIVCQSNFKKSSYLLKHIMSKHSKVKPYICEFCNKGFKFQNNMDWHKLQMHKKLIPFVACEFCRKNFVSKEKLEVHKVLKCPKRIKQTFECETCSYTADCRSKFETHLKSHNTSSSNKFTCEICGKILATEVSLNAHCRTVHTKETPFKCILCGEFFKTKEQVRLHQKRKHEKPRFYCEICNKSFQTSNYFKKHASYHTHEKPWTCEVCGKSFRQKCWLNEHLRIHTGEKPFKCSVCDASFRSYRHFVTHTGVHKPLSHICDVCGKMFTQLQKLKAHRRRHSSDFIKHHYSCKYCDKNCQTVTRYKTHILSFHPERIPSVESDSSLKFHKCSLCDKKYGRGMELKRHMELHKKRAFSCAECFRLFNTDDELESHRKRKHDAKKSSTDTPVQTPKLAHTSGSENLESKPHSCESVSVRDVNKTKSKAVNKTKAPRKKMPRKVKSDSRKQECPNEVQEELIEKEYTAVKASTVEYESVPYEEPDVPVTNTVHLESSIIPQTYIRVNNMERESNFPSLLNIRQDPPFFPGLL